MKLFNLDRTDASLFHSRPEKAAVARPEPSPTSGTPRTLGDCDSARRRAAPALGSLCMAAKWKSSCAPAMVAGFVGTVFACAPAIAQNAPREIVLGAIVPSSGPFAEWGRTNTATLQMLEKQLNAAAGSNGAKFRIVIMDDGARPAQATNNLRKLAGDD